MIRTTSRRVVVARRGAPRRRRTGAGAAHSVVHRLRRRAVGALRRGEGPDAPGVGMVAGGVLGGVLGHQIGSGRGNTVATIAGAAGGAYVGNEVEKNKNTKTYWSVAHQDGQRQHAHLHLQQPAAVHEGERVKLVDGGKRLALLAN